MEENKKKKSKGIIVLVIVLSILLLGAIGYICYDKLFTDNKKLVEETPKEEKLSEEEIKKLHDSLITKDKDYGLYFKDKITIDSISDEDLLPYIILKYLDEKNIEPYPYNLLCILYPDDFDQSDEEGMCEQNKLVTINKNDLDYYVKSLFNTDRVITPKATSADGKFASSKISGAFGYMYDLNNRVYYLGEFSSGAAGVQMSNSYLKFEQENNNLYIYDNAIVCINEIGYSCYTSLDPTDEKDLIMYYDLDGKSNIPEGFVENGDDIQPDMNYVFKNYRDKLNTYKHTFKKANDGKYYWYSSEIVNE